MHYVRGYRRRDGTYVRPHLARDPGRRSVGETRLTRKHNAIIVTVTVTVVGLGTVVVISDPPWGGDPPPTTTGTIDPVSAGDSTAIRINLNETEVGLIAHRYGGTFNLRFDKHCTNNAYGQVRQFFRSDPCRWLARVSLTLDVSGHAIALISISWVDMPNIAEAKQYKHLVDASGTGNVTELTRIEGPYQAVRYSGKNYVSGRYHTAVWNSEVQPISQLSASATEEILLLSRQ